MADISITAANVLKGSGAKVVNGYAGETFAAGAMVYQDSDGLFYKTDADASAVDSTKANALGMALNSALIIGSPVQVAKKGPVTVGTVLAKGVNYVLSGGAGLICPAADLATNDWVTPVGVAQTTAILDIEINATAILFA